MWWKFVSGNQMVRHPLSGTPIIFVVYINDYYSKIYFMENDIHPTDAIFQINLSLIPNCGNFVIISTSIYSCVRRVGVDSQSLLLRTDVQV